MEVTTPSFLLMLLANAQNHTKLFFWNPCSYWVSQQRSRTFTSEVSSKELTTNTALFWFCGMFAFGVEPSIVGFLICKTKPTGTVGFSGGRGKAFRPRLKSRVLGTNDFIVGGEAQATNIQWLMWSSKRNVWMSWIPHERTTTVHNGRLPAEILARRRLW